MLGSSHSYLCTRKQTSHCLNHNTSKCQLTTQLCTALNFFCEEGKQYVPTDSCHTSLLLLLIFHPKKICLFCYYMYMVQSICSHPIIKNLPTIGVVHMQVFHSSKTILLREIRAAGEIFEELITKYTLTTAIVKILQPTQEHILFKGDQEVTSEYCHEVHWNTVLSCLWSRILCCICFHCLKLN